MIAHVAEAGERRGRVVLHVSSRHPHRIALAAAVRLAQAFNSELESLFVEDARLLDLASYPFALEISFDGRRRRALTTADIELTMRCEAGAVARCMASIADRLEVPTRSTVVRGEPMAMLARACQETGPWNVVALGDPLSSRSAIDLADVFASVAGATGVVVVGPNARRTSGPVVVVVEDILRLEPMLRAAERLQSAENEQDRLLLVLVGASPQQTLDMEAQARLVLSPDSTVNILPAQLAYRSARELAEVIRRQRPGFVLGQFGGLLVPATGDLTHLVEALECPLFLGR